MNYYHRYPGHYIAKTLHLSMEEDGAYSRLLDWMYLNERPVPHAERYAIARAMKPSERKAVDKVLAEFFESDGAAYRQDRTEQEIAKNQPRIQAARENGRNGGRPRKTETQGKPAGLENENPLGFSEKPRAKAPQTPNTITTPDTSSLAESLPPARAHVGAREGATQAPTDEAGRAAQAAGGAREHGGATPTQAPTAAGRACLLMRQAGCSATNPSHPDLIAALAEGVTPEALADTVREAVALGKGRPFAWAIATARSRHADGARNTTTNGAAHAVPRSPLERVLAKCAHHDDTIDGEFSDVSG